MVSVAAAFSVTPSTSIVCPSSDRSPALDVTYPGLLTELDGAGQSAGTTSCSEPPTRPPVAALYVKVSVVPGVKAGTVVGTTVIVPLPSADTELTDGELASNVNTPSAVAASFVFHCVTPAGGVTPGPTDVSP